MPPPPVTPLPVFLEHFYWFHKFRTLPSPVPSQYGCAPVGHFWLAFLSLHLTHLVHCLGQVSTLCIAQCPALPAWGCLLGQVCNGCSCCMQCVRGEGEESSSSGWGCCMAGLECCCQSYNKAHLLQAACRMISLAFYCPGIPHFTKPLRRMKCHLQRGCSLTSE